jgi:hypothetical protein
MRERSILEEFGRRLPEILSEGKIGAIADQENGVDGKVDFVIGGRRIHLLFEVVARPTLALLRDKAERLYAQVGKRDPRDLPMVVAPHLNEEMREICRKMGVGYLDLSGNVWIEQGTIVIKKDVAKNLYPHQAKERSPFADRASRVLRLLLRRKEPLGVRAIAGEADLDPGYVSRVLRAASEQGYVALDARGQATVRNHEEMLGDWSSFYSWRRNQGAGYFYLGPSESDLEERLAGLLKNEAADTYGLTLHAGNNRLDPFVSYGVVHLYVAEDSLIPGRLKKELNLRSVPVEGANLVLARPYYRDSVFYGARQVEGLSVVSDLQLYLDLRRFPVRGLEAAERILERRLRPLWSKA